MSELPIPEDTMDLSGRTVVFSVDDGFHSVFTNVYPLLKKHGMSMTLALIVNSLGQGSPSYRPSSRFMNRAEVRELIDTLGIEVASHTLSHPYLTRLDSASAWREISRSRVALESLLGTEVITLAYPYGDMDSRVRRFARQAGYKLGRAVVWGEPNLWVEPYRLPTYELRRETKLADVKRRIARHRTTILILHQVVARPEAFTQWNTADFTRLLDWLVEARVRVTTLRGLYREWWFERLARLVEEVADAYPDRRKELLFEEVDVDATRAQHPR